MASLLQEIKTDILDSEADINIIMHKCFILSYKLKNDSFTNWISNEIYGYNLYDEIPNYRYIQAELKGEFFNRDTRKVELLSIDQVLLHEGNCRFTLETEFPPRLRLAVSELQAYLQAEYYYHELFSDAAMPYMSSYRNMDCSRVLLKFHFGGIKSIIENIKLNILKVLLELENNILDINEITSGAIEMDRSSKSKVTKIVNKITATNANIANASESFNQNIQLQSDELINKLVSELLQLKEQGKDVDTIDAVISYVEGIKQVKDKKSLMSKLTEIMTIAGGTASVCSVIMPYIPMLSNLFG